MNYMEGRFVAYYRVSTHEQGRSGLGLEAQQQAVLRFLNGGKWELLAEFTEIESGRRNDRPQLSKAIERCRLTGATLVIAKLDRLGRNAAFLLSLRDAGVRFVAADMPTANELTIGIMACVAQAEREMISMRTRDALAAARARGVSLGSPKGFCGRTYRGGGQAAKERAEGFAARLLPTLQDMKARGLSLNAMARELAGLGVKTPRGGAWTATAVRNALRRVG